MGRRVAAAAFLAIAALLLAAGAAESAQSAVVSIGSGSVSPGGDMTVALEARNVSGLGAVSADIIYDPNVIDAVSCSRDPGGVFDLGICNESFASDKVRFTGISAEGVSGQVRLAEVRFRAVGRSGDVSTLDVRLSTLAGTDGQALPAVAQDGSIAIGGTGTRYPQAQPQPTETSAGGGQETPPQQGTMPAPTGTGEAGQEPMQGETSMTTPTATDATAVGASATSKTSTPTIPGEQASGGSTRPGAGDDGVDWWIWLAASLGGVALVAAAAVIWRRTPQR